MWFRYTPFSAQLGKTLKISTDSVCIDYTSIVTMCKPKMAYCIYLVMSFKYYFIVWDVVNLRKFLGVSGSSEANPCWSVYPACGGYFSICSKFVNALGMWTLVCPRLMPIETCLASSDPNIFFLVFHPTKIITWFEYLIGYVKNNCIIWGCYIVLYVVPLAR